MSKKLLFILLGITGLTAVTVSAVFLFIKSGKLKNKRILLNLTANLLSSKLIINNKKLINKLLDTLIRLNYIDEISLYLAGQNYKREKSTPNSFNVMSKNIFLNDKKTGELVIYFQR